MAHEDDTRQAAARGARMSDGARGIPALTAAGRS
jgi:hypothetical protein